MLRNNNKRMLKFEFNEFELYNIHDILYVQTNIRGLLPDLLKSSKGTNDHPKLYVAIGHLSKGAIEQLMTSG